MSRAALLLLFLAPTFVAIGGSPARAASAFDSAYRFESSFLTGLKPGDTGQFSVFFDNVGTNAWAAGTFTQVNLAACAPDKVTCNVASANVSWNPGSWLSSSAYATHAKAIVAPGEFSAFTYSVRVPSGVPLGAYRFNGDLVVAATGAKLHPEGYYQDATVTQLGPQTTAPTDVQIQVANLNGGTTDNDVRVFFTAPAANPLTDYDIQRAPGDCPVANTSVFFTTVGTLRLVGGVFGAFNHYDQPPGIACYQVRVKTETGGFVYSKQLRAAVFGPSSQTTPISTSIVLTNNGGFPDILDAGDVFVITFDQAMTVSASARITVTDADCGPPASQSSGPASCTPPASQTVSDITCGTNANCALSLDARSLTVTLTGNPADVAPGSAPGAKLPVVVTASTGITAQTGGAAWGIITSPDRVIP